MSLTSSFIDVKKRRERVSFGYKAISDLSRRSFIPVFSSNFHYHVTGRHLTGQVRDGRCRCKHWRHILNILNYYNDFQTGNISSIFSQFYIGIL